MPTTMHWKLLGMPIVVTSWNSNGKTLSADLVNDQCKAQVLRDHVILSETKDLAELCHLRQSRRLLGWSG